MEASGGLGSVGSYDAKLSKGVVEVSIGVKIDLAAELQKKADALSDGLEKSAFLVVIGLLKGVS